MIPYLQLGLPSPSPGLLQSLMSQEIRQMPLTLFVHLLNMVCHLILTLHPLVSIVLHLMTLILTRATMLNLVFSLKLSVKLVATLIQPLTPPVLVLFVVVPVIPLTAAKLFLTLLVSKLHTSSFVLLSIAYMACLASSVNPISVHSTAILSAPLILLSAPLVLVLFLSGSSGGVSSPSTSSIYKLIKIQTKAIAESNRLVSARLSSLEEFIGGTGNDGDGDDASGGTGSSSLNETNMANFTRAALKGR
jgi:hypothetical protein